MFSISPAVEVNEFDLTTAVRSATTAAGAFAGNFGWGPAEEIVLVADEPQLKSIFSSPNESNRKDFLVAASFLKYSGSLNVIRAISEESHNATSDALGLLVRNLEQYEDEYESLTGTAPDFTARYAGDKGNSIHIEVANNHSFKNEVAGEFSSTGTELSYSGTSTINNYIVVGSYVRFENQTRQVISISSSNTATLNAEFENNITVGDSLTFIWEYAQYFDDSIPSTSSWGAEHSITNDEIHIIVIDRDGGISGRAGTILERFEYVSVAPGAKQENGSSNYYKNVIKERSNFVYLTNHISEIPSAGQPAAEGTDYADGSPNISITKSLSGGSIEAPSVADITRAYDMFKNTEAVDIRYVLGVPFESEQDKLRMANILDELTQARRDCIAFVSPPVNMSTSRDPNKARKLIDNFFDLISSSSYLFFDQSAVQVYDKYNDEYVWVPASGHNAGLMARTHRDFDAWWSPAGYNRGQLIGVRKVAFNPNKADRDILYAARINSIVTFPGEGTILYGDRTALARPSAFSSINVRNLFISLQKAISNASKYQLFDFNDDFTRAMFRNMVIPYLREVQGRRGIQQFKVVADETNNTAQIMDDQAFVGDIYISPARSINTIQLNFIATRTGVDFEEIIGSHEE